MIKHQQIEPPDMPGPSQLDVETWRAIKSALRTGLSDRGVEIGDDELALIARFMMEKFESGGLHLVPLKPTSEMHRAIQLALEEGKRLSVAWVKERTKQVWRWKAAIDAAPSWRRGYGQELSPKAEPSASGLGPDRI